MLSDADWSAVRLSLELASLTTLLLLLIGTPISWWLARTHCPLKGPLTALLSLPLVLPPTVLGFYLLLGLGPHGPIGRLTQSLGLGLLPFTFAGLVVGSLIYSLPFVIYPLHTAFRSLGQGPLEVAATLGAGPWDRFFSVALPLTKPAFISATVLAFAHTLGEFGVVMMIGGNIPNQTRTLSVQIFDLVEAMDYQHAHWLAGGMLVFSFMVLLALYGITGDKAGLMKCK